jgi:hypothetical protein
MHVFINDREVEPVSSEGATIGEIIEALGVYIDPREILTAVELDGVAYSAGDEDRYARRAAGGVSRLVLSTQTAGAFAAAMRAEIAAALAVITYKVESVVALFRRADERGANGLLAALLEELRLVLVLDQHIVTLDGGPPSAPVEAIREIAPELLDAQERRAWAEVRGLLERRLIPALRSAPLATPAP